jgi:hypothetical protein
VDVQDGSARLYSGDPLVDDVVERPRLVRVARLEIATDDRAGDDRRARRRQRSTPVSGREGVIAAMIDSRDSSR